MPSKVSQTEDDVKLQDDLGDEEQIPFKYSITSYGADFLIDGIVRRLEDDSILIPSFQRGFVWSLPKASRFIESLLLGLPVPGIFLSKDSETQALIVIDGQQRLKTLKFFLMVISKTLPKTLLLREQTRSSQATLILP